MQRWHPLLSKTLLKSRFPIHDVKRFKVMQDRSLAINLLHIVEPTIILNECVPYITILNFGSNQIVLIDM